MDGCQESCVGVKIFQNPVSVCSGRGSLRRLPDLLKDRTCLLVTSPGTRSRGVVHRLESICGDRIRQACSEVAPNPTVSAVTAAARSAKDVHFDVILAVGGGSVLDTAKAIAAQRHRGLPDGWLSLHLREGRPFPDRFSPAPLIAVPTTAGTGSEVTMWATLWDERTGKKYSLSHPALYPEAAIVDPELTLTTPEETTVAAGLDALSHAMEAIWNRNANPVSDTLAAGAISTIVSSLEGVLESPSEITLREKLHYASMTAGMAFSNTRTAIAHSISYPLTGRLGIPHGIACSFTLPRILTVNGEGDTARVAPIVRSLGADSLSAASSVLHCFLVRVGVPGYMQRYFRSAAEIDAFDGDFITPGRADNNIVPLTQSDTLELFRSSAKGMLSC